MKTNDIVILAGAALAVYLMLRSVGGGVAQSGANWPLEQGNTGFPPAAYTGMPAAGGGVWV